jgi:hypothetical protein
MEYNKLYLPSVVVLVTHLKTKTMKAKALFNFGKKSDSFIVMLITLVIKMMTGNNYFLSPSPTLPALQVALNEFTEALKNSGTRTIGTSAIKNQKREILLDLVKELIHYANYTAKGNLAMLETTGLPVSSGIPMKRSLEKIDAFTARHGRNSGDITLSIKATNARAAMFSYTPYPATSESTWKSHSCMKLTSTISNFTPGQRMCFQAKALGSHSQFLVSQVVNIFII